MQVPRFGPTMLIQVWRQAVAVCLAASAPTAAGAAGGAFVVDDAVIGKPGECQVEAWVAQADNGHFIGTTQPACTVRLGIPVEFTVTLAHARSEAWTHFTGLQAKVVPLDTTHIAIAFTVGRVLDVTTGDSSFSFINLPVTIKLHDQFRINLNAGGLWAERDHFTYGASLEWDIAQSWMTIAEVFGLTGPSEEPRFQLGLRHMPTKSIDLDLIYGNNLTGENAHWVTAGVTARF
jgi:hypothetical protein